jgi:PhzF family phenazine biosynthesis protein
MDGMQIRTWIVDAFTDRPFSGNPAGVCLLDSPLDDRTMKAIASELRHSETAFLELRSPGSYGLRWFTPSQEVPICGHATLAAAHVLFETNWQSDRIKFETLSGVLTANRSGSGIELDFPTEFTHPDPASCKFAAKALGSKVAHLRKGDLFWVAVLDSEDAVRACCPDLKLVSEMGLEGVIVTARSDSGADDFVSRVFAPKVGIDEDPVTGSAHCALAPYWSAELGKTELVGYQASERGGIVKVEYLGSRTLLRGSALSTFEGLLYLPNEQGVN